MKKGFQKDDSEKWNVAKGYVELKILLHMVEFDRLRKIALFGYEDILESSMMDAINPQGKVLMRLDAIKRLHLVLSTIITNTFKFTRKIDEDPIKDFKNRLKNIEDCFDGLESTSTDQRSKIVTITIYEPLFKIILDELVDIKENLIGILNDNELIFRHSGEEDIESRLKEFGEGI